MAFADPQTITIGGTAFTLNRTSSGQYKGTFETADGLHELSIEHDRRKRYRHTIRIRSKKNVTDPLVPANSLPADVSVRLTIDAPPFGYTATEQKDEVVGLLALLTASSNAAITKLVGNES